MEAKQVQDEFWSFCQTISALRDPQKGCPWDLKQTHKSLRRYMLEEAYETATEMEKDQSSKELCDELGDVLLQVVLNAKVAQDNGSFSIYDVLKSINSKMVRRHPHVFDADNHSRDEKDIKLKWEQIKRQEKGDSKVSGYFSSAEKIQPALSKACEIGKLAGKIAFDWGEPEAVIAKLESEIDELKEALAKMNGPCRSREIEREMGDVFFTCAQLARHLGLDPESTAHLGNNKFLQRFSKLELLAKKRGIDVTSASHEQLDQLWQESKS